MYHVKVNFLYPDCSNILFLTFHGDCKNFDISDHAYYKYTEAVACRSSVKYLFFKISQYSQQNIQACNLTL